jgi:O-methyltransferase
MLPSWVRGPSEMKIPTIIREPLLNIARRLGYGIYKINSDESLYGPILSEATYSPWNKDTQFRPTYDAVKSHTLVDQYKCYELWTLIEMLSQCEGHLIEIGVWRGGSGALIAKRAQLACIADTVYLCDTFSGVVKASQSDTTYVGGEHSDTSEQDVSALLKDLGLSNVKILHGIFPDETGASVERLKFRFCHIDVDVYQSAKDIVEWVWPKLTVGGVIVYDDYGTETTAGVTRYVNEQAKMRDRLTVYNLNGHAITVKTR